MPTADERNETMLVSLRDLAELVVNDLNNGNKGDARLRLSQVQETRRSYVVWCVTGMMPETEDRIDVLESFFRSITS